MTPWEVTYREDGAAIVAANGETIASGLMLDDAFRIVRAVNLFDDLVAAVTRLLPYAERIINSTDREHEHDHLRFARAVLARAESREG